MLSFKQFKTTKSTDFEDILNEFVDFCAEALQLDELPVINAINDGSMGSTFGCYSDGEISINMLNRHPMDVLRTLAHELVHYRQDCDGELHERSGEDGSDHENEANAMAGVLMRQFGRDNKHLFERGAILEGCEIEGEELNEANKWRL